jgi:hypothetical protein
VVLPFAFKYQEVAFKAVAETSTQRLMPWIMENLGLLLASAIEVIDGTVVLKHDDAGRIE